MKEGIEEERGERGSLTSPAFPLLHGNREHLSHSGPIVSRTEPEAHSQADGPYTSA